MHRLRRRPALRAGFIHLPSLPQVGTVQSGMALDQQLLAVRLALRTALAGAPDVRRSGGAID